VHVSARKRLNESTARGALTVRRAVDSSRVRAPVRHMTLPFHEIAQTDLIEGETIDTLVKRTEWAERIKIGRRKVWSFRLPTICVVNGKPVLQTVWRRLRLRADDVVEFWSRPMGGSGRGGGAKQILGLVAVIALAAFAPWAGGALAGAMSLGSTAATIISGAITLGGSLLISALTTPKPGGQGDSIDQIYSVSASGNTARLLEPITVQYGRVKSFPDFATTPWSEFEGNDQYLNILLAIGMGEYEYEQLFIDDTILWDTIDGISDTFSDVDVAFYAPDEQVELFPTNVTQAAEVSGQLLSTSYVGGFIANTSGTVAKALAVDLVFPSGCYTVNDSGDLASASTTIVVEARKVDDAGAPIGAGSFIEIHNTAYTYKTRNPVRLTIKETVDSGRYEVRVKRTDEPINGSSGSDEVAWAGLRAFIDAANTFPCSTVALRIRATNQLSNAKRFGVLCTRILPVWDTGTELFVDTATRSPAWAFYDATTDTTYGAGRAASKVDFQSVYDLAVAAAARSDNFDFRFSSATPAPEVFDTILRGTRARHRWSGDLLTIVRDEWSDTPRMLLTDREIARGSLSIDYALNTDDSADSVILEYLDQSTWQPAEVQYPPNSESFTSVSPARMRIPGVVVRAHAYREAAFYYLQSQLRRVNATLDTEHDGRMLGFGSRVRVQSELPLSWGYTGAITNNASGTLTLSPAPTWAVSGSHYIAIRTKTGRQFGPVLCTQGANAALAVLDPTDLSAVETAQSTTIAAALTREDGADDPSFDFGVGDSRARSCLVLSGRPSGDRVTLRLVVDNEAVHETNLGSVPTTPTVPALRDPQAPVISTMYANFRQGIAEPVLEASWSPAAGAQYYVAEVSYDSGASWTPIYEGQSPNLSAVVDYAALRLRVQGVGVRRGAWTQVDVSAPTIIIASGTVDTSSLTAALDAAVRTVLDRLPIDLFTIRQDLDSVSDSISQHVSNILERLGHINIGVGSRYGENKAAAELALQAATDVNSSLAALFVDLFAQNDQGEAEGLIRFVAAALPTGAVSSFAIEARASFDEEFESAGIYVDVGAFSDGSTSRIRLLADNTNLEDSSGNIRRLMAAVIADTPNSAPITSGNIKADLRQNIPVSTTTLDGDAEVQFPLGARLGFPFWHVFTQDGTGGRAVTFDNSAITSPAPTVNTTANVTTILQGLVHSLVPPVMTYAAFGDPGQTTSSSTTIFALSPAYAGITVWNTAIDGPLTIDGPYSGTITPLGTDLRVDIELWGPGGTGGAGGFLIPGDPDPVIGSASTFQGITAGAGGPGLSNQDNNTGKGAGGTASGGDVNTNGSQGGGGDIAPLGDDALGGTGAGGTTPGGGASQPYVIAGYNVIIHGVDGNAPGGGGRGGAKGRAATSANRAGSGGGEGAYSKKTYGASVLLQGVPYALVVGEAGGIIVPGNGAKGGKGAPGRCVIT